MCNVPSLGALIKGSKEYVYPGIAKKTEKYECPDCHKDLIFRKGDVRIHHFAHRKSDNPCTYYSGPSESQIHKDAKMLLKNLLERKTKIIIKKKCCGEFEIPMMTDKSKIVLEHRFEYNGLKIADVAYLEYGHLNCVVCRQFDYNFDGRILYPEEHYIKYIFEICNTHKTDKNKRPETWFELDARKVIKIANSGKNMLIFPCMRTDKCYDCVMKSRLANLEPKELIYVDVPYSDREYAKSLGMHFDFDNHRKWAIWSDNKNKDLILSKYAKIVYEDNEIENYERLSHFMMNILKDKNQQKLDLFVKKKLGRMTHPRVLAVYGHMGFDNIVRYEHYVCPRSYGLGSFLYHVECNGEALENNKKIIDVFQKYFGMTRCLVYSAKGGMTVYVIDVDDYNKHDYWNGEMCEDHNGTEYPYLFCDEDYCEGTVSVIKGLLKKTWEYNLHPYIFDNTSESDDPSECEESEEINNVSDHDKHEEYEEYEECEESEDSFDPFK